MALSPCALVPLCPRHRHLVTLSPCPRRPARFHPKPDGDTSDARPNPDPIFTVPDLPACHARAKAAGCSSIGDIKDWPWGERSFYLKDPFGNPLCFADERTAFTGGRFIA